MEQVLESFWIKKSHLSKMVGEFENDKAQQ